MIGEAIVLALAACGGALLGRGAAFVPPRQPDLTPEPVEVDRDAAVDHLRQLVQLPTISAYGVDQPVFEEFRQLLTKLYPTLHGACPPERIGKTGLVYRIPGKSPKDPAVFMAHYDVVPVDENAWEKPPFGGVLEDGVLWGRGTLDMKNQLCATLEAAELLLNSGFVPEHDIYLAYSGEEETMGPTAAEIRDVFKARGIRPALVLDEGGDIMDGFFPGADVRCAMIGVGEKGAVNLEFSAASNGGHASTPVTPTPLYRVARAVARMEEHPWRCRKSAALDQLVDTMGRYCGFWQRVLLANRDVLRPLYIRWLKKQGGMLLAMAHTTLVCTMAQGSDAANVIPTNPKVVGNLRLLWGDTTESAIARLHQIIGDDQVQIRSLGGSEPQPDSRTDGSYDKLTAAIRATWPDAVPTPYLMVAGTDSRHWRELCDHVYRFSAKQVTREEKSCVHGNNERIRVENTEHAVQFYVRLMRQC